MKIALEDNEINIDGDNHSFATPYEITINQCHVKNIMFYTGEFVMHLDISETEAQTTLSTFVNNIAKKCNVETQLNINNIVVKLNFDKIKASGTNIEAIKKNPYLLKGANVDVTLDWTDFIIRENNMSVSLWLTSININELQNDPPSHQKNAPTRSQVTLDTVIRETSIPTLDPSVASDLFYSHENFNLSYKIE